MILEKSKIESLELEYQNILNQRNKLHSILLMVFNCLIAASVPIIIKYTSNDFALSSIVAAYHLIATILSIVIILYCKISVKTRFLHLHMLRSVLSTSAYFLYFYALSITSIANAIALAHTDAILTCLFASFFLKEKMTQTDVINLSLSFIGSLMIIMPGRDIMNIGALLAFCSAILWALSNIIIKKLSETDKTQTQLFYSNIFTFILAFMVAFCNNEHTNIISDSNIGWVVLLGLMIFAQYFALFKALSLAKTTIIMPFFVVGVIFGNILGTIFFGETQEYIEIIGTIFVIAVNIYQIILIKLGKL